MGHIQNGNTLQNGRHSYIWIAVASVLMIFANGRWIVPAASWLGPVFLIRFLRSQSRLKGLLIAYVLLTATFFISWRGAAPIPFITYYILIGLLTGLVLLLPFILDRLIFFRFSGFLATLVLPVSWVAVDFINAKLSPYGHWGMIAYTQHGNLPLLQILSITGIWGVTFLMAWFASTVNWVWENNADWGKIRNGLAVYAGILVMVLLFGGTRLILFPPHANTVRIASVSALVPRSSISHLTEEEKAAKVLDDRKIHDTLFNRSKIGASSGAKLILWAEANAQVEKAHESKLIERGQRFAKKENVHLAMSLFTAIPDQYRRENKTIVIDSSGEIISVYFKSRPPPGEPSVIGDGIIPVLNTPFGKISSVICSDMDSPFHLRQQSVKAGIDIMLAPSWDWPEITPIHTWMTAFRGIENGFSIVRQANDGLSQASDYHGNILASMNHYNTDEHIMISQVPTKGTTTVYSRIGDVFPWLCIVALTLMIGKTVIRKK